MKVDIKYRVIDEIIDTENDGRAISKVDKYVGYMKRKTTKG